VIAKVSQAGSINKKQGLFNGKTNLGKFGIRRSFAFAAIYNPVKFDFPELMQLPAIRLIRVPDDPSVFHSI
jgi:hypothetical protein